MTLPASYKTVCLCVCMCGHALIRPTFITPAHLLERTEPSRSTRRPSCCSRTEINMSAGSSGGSHPTKKNHNSVFKSVQRLYEWISSENKSLKVPSRLLQREPSQDGEDLGREGDEEPYQVRTDNKTWCDVDFLLTFTVWNCVCPSRLQTAGIQSPEPLLLRSHVLLMGFIGKDNM